MDIIARDEWCTTPRRATPVRIPDRLPRRWLHHGAQGQSTVATANAYARYHIEAKGWADVGYSWLVAEGKVLEGRGPGRQGAHTKGDNASSYGICLVGNYASTAPDDRDLDALVWLLTHGQGQGWWAEPALTGGHRDAPGANTSCPGAVAHRMIPQINGRAAPRPAPQEEDDLTPDERQMLTEIHAALDAGKSTTAIDRIRRSLRPIGRALGLKADVNGTDEDVIA